MGRPGVPALHRALRTYLAQTEQEDEYQRQRITRQRADRTADLAAARKGLAEAAQAAAAHRSSVAEGIKAKLKKVAAQFGRLDEEYGGYGATLDFPEPEPAEPDKPWRWNVTVIGALQDDMERYAIDASGQYVKLRRSSDASPYNSAPVIAGHDGNAARLALLHGWLAGHYPGRPAADAELEDAAR